MPSSEDLSAVTGANDTSTAATTAATPVVVNGPLGNSALAFTPQSFAFGTLVQNSGSATKTFTVTNTSTYTLVLGTIAGVNANFTVTANTCTNGFSMLSDATCAFTVQFAPTVSGNLSASIAIPYDVVSASNQFSSLLSVTGAGTSLVGFAGLDAINNQTPTAMRLNWTDVAGASTYQVYNTDSGTPVLLASVISENLVPGIGCGVGSPAGAGQCSYTATGLLPSTSHAYRVLASDFLGVQSINTHDVTSQTTADFLDLGGAASASAGACTPLTVALTQADHATAETVSANTSITISGLGSGTIYSDNTCGTLIASPVVIVSGTSSTTFYFKDNVAEGLTLSATRSQFSSTSRAFTVNPLATIASVAYVAAPGAAYTASNSAPMTTFTVAIKDSFGNVITTNSTATITASRASGTGALSGTVTRTVSSGVATFNDITYTKSETITIKATENASGNSYNVTSSNITVNPAAVASVVWGTAPGAAYTASSTPMPTFTAELKDALGNVVTSDNTSTVTLTRTGTGTLGGTLTKTVSSGVATFDDVVYTKAESVTLTATESSANHYFVTKDIAVSPAAFSLSQSQVSSAASVNSGASITVTLAAKDAFGNTGPSGITTVSFTSSLVGGTGTYGAVTNAGSGVYTVSFTGVIAGSITLGATINGGTVTSAPAPATIAVNPSPTIASVVFVAAPPATFTASTTTPMTAFTAAVKDANGNVITSNSTAHITVLGVGSTALGGTLTKTVSSGVATFDDITYTKAETIQIKATEDASGSNLNVTSSSITVNPSPVIASVIFVAAPPATYTASNTTPMTTFTAAVKDSFGNIITTDNATTITASRATGTGVLSGTLTRTVSSGVATFDDLTYTKPETITIQTTENASTHGYSVASSNITVTAHLAFTTQPSSSGDTDTTLPQQPVVAVQDGAGATASGATNSITLTAYSDSACTVPVASALTATTNPLSATSGVATFTGIKILKTNVVRIGASATGITSACSSAIATAAGAVNLAQSTVAWVPASLIADNVATSAITVTLKDANGNGVPGKTVTATSDRGADTISGSGGSTNSSGVVNLTARSSSTGASTITVVGNGTAMNPTVQVQFLSATPLTDYQSRIFNAIGPGDNSSSVKSVWKDLSQTATTYDGSLLNFLFNGTSGWSTKNYRDEVLADNPVGYWRLNETSGTIAGDSSGNGHDGTYTGGYTLVQTGALSGDSDTAASFNGSSGYIQLGNSGHAANSQVSVSAWIKTNASGVDQNILDEIGDGGYGGGISIRIKSDGKVRFYNQDATFLVDSTYALTLNQWYYVVGTYDGVYNKLYINGALNNSTAVGTQNTRNAVNLHIGHSQLLGGYFSGNIDEVAVFNSALSASRILTHYNVGVHPDHPLVFDGSTSNSYVDFGTGVNNNTNFSFETWIKPTNTAATGKVILSNGQTVNPGTSSQTDTGLTLRQSKFTSGKLELFLGESGEASYTQEVLSDAPAGYWRLGETSGATAADSSGNGHDGTYMNITLGGAGALLGDVDASAQFNGSTSFAEALGLTLGDQYTMEVWFKTSNPSADPQYIVARGSSSGFENFGFYQNRMIVWDGAGYPSGSTTLSASTWYHAVMVRNGTHVRIYLNGSDEIGDYNFGAGSYDSSRILIGKRTDGAWPFQGLIDEVAIYNTALSSARILAHYSAALKKKTCFSTSTLADNVWRFVSGVFDSTGPTLKLFVDGTQECSITNAGAAFTGSANPLRAGRDSSASNSWAGQMADVRTYNSALAATDVQKNMVVTRDRFPNIPSSISGLKLWLKADDLITSLNDGNPVAQWNDASENSNNATQGTGANQPVYKTGILNGRPVVRFGNAGSASALNTPQITMTARTMFVVYNVLGSPPRGYHALIIQNLSPYDQLYCTSNSTWNYWMGTSIDSTVSCAVGQGTKLLSVTSGAAGHAIYVNGVQKGTNGNAAQAFTNITMTIGDYGNINGFNGDIAEILIYNQAFSDADRQAVEAYLNAKYGLY